MSLSAALGAGKEGTGGSVKEVEVKTDRVKILIEEGSFSTVS